MKSNYYDEKLNSQKLFQVYQTNIPRIEQYLAAEIEFVRKNLKKTETVLELGAGYGRIVRELAPYCAEIVGIDISDDSVRYSKDYLSDLFNAKVKKMNIHNMVMEETYDVVLCLQNGLSAMRATEDTIKHIRNLVSPGGRIYFSSYSEKFWDYRLLWFQEQAEKGLLGEIDMRQTKDGVIVCKDGFKATTHSVSDFEKIGKLLGFPYQVKEVDESSLFLVVYKA